MHVMANSTAPVLASTSKIVPFNSQLFIVPRGGIKHRQEAREGSGRVRLAFDHFRSDLCSVGGVSWSIYSNCSDAHARHVLPTSSSWWRCRRRGGKRVQSPDEGTESMWRM